MLNEDTLHGARGDRILGAYSVLRELIVDGRLSPGTRIIETEVAQRLGFSRTPVRAALQRLQQEGYVRVSGPGQQARMSVTPLTVEDARELFGIVAEIEGLASRWASEARERKELVSRLRGLNRDLSEAASHAEAGSIMIATDRALHRAIVEAVAGPRIASMHDALQPQVEWYAHMYPDAFVNAMGEAVAEHEALVEAIEAGLGAVADAAMRRNWQTTTDQLTRAIMRSGEKGNW